MTKQRAAQIKSLFLQHFAGAKSELIFKNPYELIVCVMLSAQCTDKRVNLITPSLFKAYPTAAHLAKAKLNALKIIIQSCSFFNNKAQNLIKMAKAVCERHGGEIPLTQNELKSLAGVGQKSTNVVLIEWCGANVMAVDTHIFRVAHRLNLSSGKTPEAVEADLTALFKTELNRLHQAIVLFGRYTCKAKNPLCTECFLSTLCGSTDKRI